jgi:precorrin-6A/cobalt-precorrin-6A reductase
MLRLLILGGTTEASALARHLAGRADFAPVLSLAGRTRNPITPPIPFRIGGFGGVDGLKRHLAENRIDLVVDATHPFAEQMSANAVKASRDSGIPLAVLTRPAWHPGPGDNWRFVPNMVAAAHALGSTKRRVFLTVGGLQLAAFVAAPQHRYLVRTIETPEAIADLPDHRLILARGPFTVDDETALMRDEGIEVLVTKNSGGNATEAKLEATRTLGIEVILVERPAAADVPAFETVEALLGWVETHRPAP